MKDFKQKRFSSALVGYFFTIGVFFNFFFVPYKTIGFGPMEHGVLEWSPLGRCFNSNYYVGSSHHKIGREFMKRYIPEGASLSTMYHFATHLSHRRILRIFPNTEGVQYIFIDLFCEIPNVFVNFGHLFYRQSLIKLLIESPYGVVKYQDGYLLLKRGFSQEKNSRILQELVKSSMAIDFLSSVGGIRPDPEALGHLARVADAKWDREGVLVSGMWQLPEGSYRGILKLKTSHNNLCMPIGELLLTRVEKEKREVVFTKTLHARDFDFNSHYQDFLIDFHVSKFKGIELKINFLGEGDLWFGGLNLKVPQLSLDQIYAFLKEKKLRFKE
jgi:hypothetical protein